MLPAPATQREQQRAQARKLKQIEKEQRQQQEREQGKAMFENSSSTKGRKLGGAVPAFPSERCLTLRCGCSQEETKVLSDRPTMCVLPAEHGFGQDSQATNRAASKGVEEDEAKDWALDIERCPPSRLFTRAAR